MLVSGSTTARHTLSERNAFSSDIFMYHVKFLDIYMYNDVSHNIFKYHTRLQYLPAP